MSEYVLRLLIALPLICGLILASLWLGRKLQNRSTMLRGERLADVVEVQGIAPGSRLAVIAFGGKHILIGIDRHGIHRLGRANAS